MILQYEVNIAKVLARCLKKCGQVMLQCGAYNVLPINTYACVQLVKYVLTNIRLETGIHDHLEWMQALAYYLN